MDKEFIDALTDLNSEKGRKKRDKARDYMLKKAEEELTNQIYEGGI
jgi:hypothetical protein